MGRVVVAWGPTHLACRAIVISQYQNFFALVSKMLFDGCYTKPLLGTLAPQI